MRATTSCELFPSRGWRRSLLRRWQDSRSCTPMSRLPILQHHGRDGAAEERGRAACLVAAILFFGVFVKALRSKSYGRALWLLGLAVVSALLALEEVSWGQHIFGFATPAGIAALNPQHETNFHNFRGTTLSRTSWASSYCLRSSSSRRCSPRMIDWRASSRRFRCRLCRCKSPRER